MASPTFVSEAAATDITQALSKACPFTTPTAGDLILVGCYFKDGVGAISTPAGYTKLEDLAGASDSGKSAVFFKTSDGTETSVTCQIATSTTSIAISVIVLRGSPVAANICIAADTEAAGGAAGTYDTPAGACDTNDDAHVAYCGFYYSNDAGVASVPTGYTQKGRAYAGGSFYRLEGFFAYKLDGNSTTIAATTGTSSGTTAYVNAHVFGVTAEPVSTPVAAPGPGRGLGMAAVF